MYEDQPVGEICVQRDGNKWVVAVCRGLANAKPLASFPERAEAAEFALAERDRRRAEDGVELTVHFPDDCPCYRTYREL